MGFTDREKEQMTSFLNEFLENNNLLTRQVEFFVEKYNCEYDEAEYLIRTICEINESENLQIFVTERFNSGSYSIVSIDNYIGKKFVNQGGFREHFANKSKEGSQGVIDNLNINNSGVIGNQYDDTKETNLSMTSDNPIVFISYSWDNEDHKNWILSFSKKLSDNGIQVILDRYELKPGANMIHFMESAINRADKVLIVFTPNYRLKADKRNGGVGYEYSIMNLELYQKITDNDKYIPVLKSGEFQDSIPSFMQQFIAVDMREITTYEDKFNELLLAIYDKPHFPKPTLGKDPFSSSKLVETKMQHDDLVIDSLKNIKVNTNFLWKGISELTEYSNGLSEEIKESTLISIKSSIDNLEINGLFSYKVEFDRNSESKNEKIYLIQLKNITTQFKNLVKLINNNKI